MLRSTLAATIGCALVVLPDPSRAQTAFVARAERDFTNAVATFRRSPADTNAAVALARAAFNRAEYATTDSQRADIAQQGIAAARAALAKQTNHGAAHYWLGMNIGQVARTKSLGALRLVREIAGHFQRARELDENADFAGPDRSLGLLYRDAPGWPTSLGNKKKAREHLERAVKLHPEFPENPLCLLETFEEWGERQNFERQLKTTELAFTGARGRLAGADWEANWADWDRRFVAVKAKAASVGRALPSRKGS
jgi:tetratricopeptide (TPR) repeat protein